MGASSQQSPGLGERPLKVAPRTLTSRELLGESTEVIIEHDGDLYRLRCTSKGKLILTK